MLRKEFSFICIVKLLYKYLSSNHYKFLIIENNKNQLSPLIFFCQKVIDSVISNSLARYNNDVH